MKLLEPYQLIYEDRYFSDYLRKGIIVDSCILLDFLNWHFLKDKKDTNLTEEEKKVLEQLEKFLSLHCKKYITQHALAELSNNINILTSSANDFSNFIELIKKELKDYEDIPISKEDILKEEMINKFGVTDTGIKLLARKDGKIILTKDKPFCDHCKYEHNLPAIHLKDLDSLFLTLSTLQR